LNKGSFILLYDRRKTDSSLIKSVIAAVCQKLGGKCYAPFLVVVLCSISDFDETRGLEHWHRKVRRNRTKMVVLARGILICHGVEMYC
jgi:hypothetical protein